MSLYRLRKAEGARTLRHELFIRYRSAKIIPLGLVASFCTKPRKLFGGFDSLGQDTQIKAVSQCHDRANDSGVAGIAGQIPDKTLIDFKPRNR